MRKSIFALALSAICLMSLPAMAQDSGHFGVSKAQIESQHHALAVSATPAVTNDVAVSMPSGNAIKSEPVAKPFDVYAPMGIDRVTYEAIYKDRTYTPLNL